MKRLAHKPQNLVIAISLLVLASCASKSTELDATNSEKIWALDGFSYEMFGVSLPAIALLSDWSRGSFTPVLYLEQSGRIFLIQELEDADLVVVHRHQGFPDGTQRNQEHIRLEPTSQGLEIVAAFRVLIDEIRESKIGEDA